MNILVVAASLIALGAAGAVPAVPGDNTGYVEGVSRYIWMSDGEEAPELVDLQEPVDQSVLRADAGLDNQYWLYTRKNPTTYQQLVKGNINSVLSSWYSADRPTKVISHGWHNNGNSDVNKLVKEAFLEAQDCNVIVVDWNKLSNSNYISAAHGVPSVGKYLGDFLSWLLKNTGGSWNDVHLVGHSLGAHVAGIAGRRGGGLVRRVTGLDPAGPLWYGNDEALDTSCGKYVEAIHTDGGILGIYDRLAHVDFYPNGGTNPQPGCWISTCSHSRSYQYFAASVRYNHFSGRECFDMDQVKKDKCTGSLFEMGNGILTKTGFGIFRVTTKDAYPF